MESRLFVPASASWSGGGIKRLLPVSKGFLWLVQGFIDFRAPPVQLRTMGNSLCLGQVFLSLFVNPLCFLQLVPCFLPLHLFCPGEGNFATDKIHHATEMMVLLEMYRCLQRMVAVALGFIQAILGQSHIGHTDEVEHFHARSIFKHSERKRLHIQFCRSLVFPQLKSNPAQYVIHTAYKVAIMEVLVHLQSHATMNARVRKISYLATGFSQSIIDASNILLEFLLQFLFGTDLERLLVMLDGNRVQSGGETGHRLAAQRLNTQIWQMHPPHLEDFEALCEVPGGVIVAREVDRHGSEPDQVERPAFALSVCRVIPVILDRLRLIE